MICLPAFYVVAAGSVTVLLVLMWLVEMLEER